MPNRLVASDGYSSRDDCPDYQILGAAAPKVALVSAYSVDVVVQERHETSSDENLLPCYDK